MTAPSPPPASPGRPLLGFFIDLLLGIGMTLVAGLGTMLLWGLARGWMLAAEARRQGIQLDGSAITRALGQPDVLVQMLMALAGTASAALLLYFWRRPANAVERARSHAAATCPATWGWVAVVTLAVFAFSSLASVAAGAVGIDLSPGNLPLVEQGLLRQPLFLIAFAVVLAPVFEELLFRRVLFGRLLAAGRPWLGIGLSSAAFALAHGASGGGWLGSVLVWGVYATMGAAFAWVYWRTGTLWASIATHALNNAAALAALHWFGIH